MNGINQWIAWRLVDVGVGCILTFGGVGNLGCLDNVHQ